MQFSLGQNNDGIILNDDQFNGDLSDNCDAIFAPGNGTVNCRYASYSLNTESVIANSILGADSLAVSLAFDNIYNSQDSVELNALLMALRKAYIYVHHLSAKDTLRKYAMASMNPGIQMDLVTKLSLVHLIAGEILVSNWEGALEAIDTLLQRDIEDIVKAEYCASKFVYLIKSGDSIYLTSLDSLLFLYPTSEIIKTAKYITSRDTMYYYPKTNIESHRQSKAQIKKAIIYPNPTISRSSVIITGDADAGSILLYDYLGRTVERSLYQYSRTSYGIDVKFSLRPGIYFIQVAYDDKIECHKLIIKGN